MILEICNYDEYTNMIINNQDSKSHIDFFFFLSAIVQQKKLIDMIEEEETSSIKGKNDVSLLDFMPNNIFKPFCQQYAFFILTMKIKDCLVFYIL